MKKLVFCFIIFCAGLEVSYAQINSNGATQNITFFNQSWACNEGREAWLASMEEILFADSLIKRQFQKDNSRIKIFRRISKERSDYVLQSWNLYHRQVCSDWKDGHKILKFQYLIIDSSYSMDRISSDFIPVIGGGNHVWKVLIDIEKNRILKIDFD